jgi:hypothetical protein
MTAGHVDELRGHLGRRTDADDIKQVNQGEEDT